MPKRKASYAAGPSTRRGRGSKPGSSKKRRVVPGVTRTGGYYGRFAGAGMEAKFWDVAHSFTIDNTTEIPTSGQLSLVPQGNTESSVVGRKYTVTSIQGKYGLVLAPGAQAVPCATIWAIYLVQDTQCNGAVATAADVFAQSGNAVLGHRNLANSQRFKILKKWTGSLAPQAGATTALNGATKYIEFYKKCNIPIEFSGTGGAITDNRSNNIFMLAGAHGSADDLITVTGTTRLRFTDRS